eukprot:6468763-Amphidinium_carterae.1
MEDADLDAMLRVLAGVIHLGDIPVGDGEDASTNFTKSDEDIGMVELNEDSAAKAAMLLGMDSDELVATLKRKKVQIKGRSSCHEVPRTPAQFYQALHSLIKAIYKRLFERTVAQINDSFKALRPEGSASEDSWQHIGILDIYGFERLQRNSFEQLCINLTNERLQQFFVANVLVAEQGVYHREGLKWQSLALPDAEPVVSCISHVFKHLDDFSSRLAKGFDNASDERFCERVVDESSKDVARKDVLFKAKVSSGGRKQTAAPALNQGFVIKHYAGTVDYTTQGWLQKNNDRLLLECEDLIASSSNELVYALREDDKGGQMPFRSISKKYTNDLESLLQTLGTCKLHYIRCFKPNEVQKPGKFDDQLVMDQIVQCGTIELVKIMHDGFPNRCSFDDITTRFKSLLPENFQRYGYRTFIQALMEAYDVPRAQWELGLSKLFLKAGQLSMLENLRSEGAVPDPAKLARIVKDIIRKRWSRAVHSIQFALWFPKYIRGLRVDRMAAQLRARLRAFLMMSRRLAAARERIEAERARIAAEKAERERLERERLAAEQAERERLELERLAAEQAEREREQAERERIEAEKAE